MGEQGCRDKAVPLACVETLSTLQQLMRCHLVLDCIGRVSIAHALTGEKLVVMHSADRCNRHCRTDAYMNGTQVSPRTRQCNNPSSRVAQSLQADIGICCSMNRLLMTDVYHKALLQGKHACGLTMGCPS